MRSLPRFVAPSFQSTVDYVATVGDEVADLSTLAGFEPDPEQRLCLDQIFGMNAEGGVAAFEFAVICARQNLKTGLFKQAALGWLFLDPGARLTIWSAQQFDTSSEAFIELEGMIGATPELSKRVRRVSHTRGAESIETNDGSRLLFKARSKASGRGFSGDRVVFDEALFLKPSHLGALQPLLSARPDPQIVYGSSAGLLDSEVLRGIRDRGRTGKSRRLSYVEWCDPHPNSCDMDGCDHSVGVQGCALDDESRWQLANPQLGRRIKIETIRAERASLPPNEFARERMGWWEDPLTDDEGAVTAAQWAKTITTDAPTGVLSLAIDVAPGHTWSTIMVCGDGVMEMVDRRRGTGWLFDRLPQLCARHGIEAIGLDPAGPAGSILPELERLDVPLLLLDGKESVRACGAIAAAIADGAVHHRGESELLAAAGGASRRPVGDGWKWSRKDSTVDISPLVAATIAHWLWLSRANEPIDPDLHFI